MHSLLAFWLACVLASAAAAASAANPIAVSLLAPPEPLAAGHAAAVELAALNRGSDPAAFTTPDTLVATLAVGNRSWTIELHAETAPGATASLPAGGFALRRYAFVLPAPAVGRAVLEVGLPATAPVRAVLDIAAGASDGSAGGAPGRVGAEPAAPPRANMADAPSQLGRPRTNASVFERTFASRLGAHEPVYFIYGADTPAAKFQISFKYRLLDFTASNAPRMESTLQVAFTQRSLWDLNATSSPFYDTSYMPEVMFESLTYRPESDNRWLTWLGYQAGFKHESNGRDGPVSRSLNTVFFRPVFALGDLDHWYAIVAPEIFGYVGGLSENPRLEDYRGFGQLRVVLGRNAGPALMVTAIAGRRLEHGSVQLDLTVPVRTKLLDFETFLLVQYFNGYGESLLNYRSKSEAIRAGVSLVR